MIVSLHPLYYDPSNFYQYIIFVCFFFFNLRREFIIDGLSVERNHVLVRVGVVGGPSERKLPPRDLEPVSYALLLITSWF